MTARFELHRDQDETGISGDVPGGDARRSLRAAPPATCFGIRSGTGGIRPLSSGRRRPRLRHRCDGIDRWRKRAMNPCSVRRRRYKLAVLRHQIRRQKRSFSPVRGPTGSTRMPTPGETKPGTSSGGRRTSPIRSLRSAPSRIADHLPTDWGPTGYPNVWLGVSAENQHWYDIL